MAFYLMVICCLSSFFELSGKGHTVSAFSSFGMGHLLSLVQNLCRWDLLQNCLADMGILDTVAPRSLQSMSFISSGPFKNLTAAL